MARNLVGAADTRLPRVLSSTARSIASLLLVCSCVLVASSASADPEPVVWTNVVGASSAVGSLTKTGTAVAWDSGGVSTKALSSSDGYVEFVAADSVPMAGLSYGETNQDLTGTSTLRSTGAQPGV